MSAMLQMLAALALAFVPQTRFPLAPPHAGPPPVPVDTVVIVLDDVGYESVQRGPRPNLEQLALDGFVFNNAFSNPLCSPARYSLQTGAWQIRGQLGQVCGAPDALTPPLSAVFLPELFGTGWSSAIFGKWHLGSNLLGAWELAPQSQGYDLWTKGLPVNVDNCGGQSYLWWLRVQNGTSAIVFNKYQPSETVSGFQSWWPNAPSPKVAVVCPQLVHKPFHRPPANLLPAGYPLTGSDPERYEAMQVAMDTIVGQILSAVDRDLTLVVVVGDNGPDPLMALVPAHAKGTVFDEGIHVPLLIAGPGVPAGGQSNQVVHIADIAPTITGTATPNGLSLWPIMQGTQVGVLHQFILCGQEQDAQWPLEVCARGARYKLRRTAAGDELYDTFLDPLELVDQAANPSLATKLATMQAWLTANMP